MMFDFKAFRKSKGLTQEDMAEILGLSQAPYSRVETGNFIPSDDKLAEYMQNIKRRYPDFNPARYTKEPKDSIAITQKNILGANYIGLLERQSEMDRVNLQQVVEALRNELEQKNRQICEKDSQINRLLAIIAERKFN